MIINTQHATPFLKQEEIDSQLENAVEQLKKLKNKTGKGNDFLGWMDLPENTSIEDIEKINTTAQHLQQYEAVVVIGIGGSYLGSKAIIDLFKPYFKAPATEVLFAGQNLDEQYITELLEYLKTKNFAVIVISKSGTTLEPALAFRLLLEQIKVQFGEAEIKERVVAITDEFKGALKKTVDTYQLQSFIVPEDVGGRYSVLTPVGLLPIAVAGIDISKLMASAKNAASELLKENTQNPAVVYAAYRHLLYQKGYTNEMMVYAMPKWNAFSEWWKQLFGESEGKEHKGIFPVSMNITTDLHSLGQYVQDGKRNIFETFIGFKEKQTNLSVDRSEENVDGLNYIADKSVHFVNSKAEEGTIEAHQSGGVPILKIELNQLDVETVGQMIYFYELSCGISAYLLGVNPFDQPGVEAYKQNMFKLLGK